MQAWIVENDPDKISLDGAPDPFPLSPQEIEENKRKEEEKLEALAQIRAMRIKAEDLPNMSYSRIDMEVNENVKSLQDEYENFDENWQIPKDSPE